MKFLPRCQLSVEVAPNAQGMTTANIVIPPELTIDFDINRSSLSSSQTATFRIENLNEETRNLLHKDQYATTEARAIQFRAGYGKTLPLCFNGRVLAASSYRAEGSADFITEITAFDGGFAMVNGWTSVTIAAGTSVSQILANLAASLPQLTGKPIIGNFPDTNRRGKVLFGNTWNILLTESNGLATIDNGQVKALQLNEAIDIEQTQIPVINSTTGLLGSPRRSATNIQCELLFEPRLTIGQVIKLESEDNRAFNGLYKVFGFTHRGTISPTKDRPRRTTVLLYFGSGEWNMVKAQLVQ